MTKEETLAWVIDANEKLEEIFHDLSFIEGVRWIAFDASMSTQRLRLLLEYPDETEFIYTSSGPMVRLTKELQ